MSARPWRAAAYLALGPSRVYIAHAAAKTSAGLDAFCARHEANGYTVARWEVQPIPEVSAVTQVPPSPAR